MTQLATDLCACGRPTKHRGMCASRWAARGGRPARSGIIPKHSAAGQPKRRFIEHTPPGNPYELSRHHPAVLEGRTLFAKRRLASAMTDRLLKSGEHNRKIGATVAKGRLHGAHIFTLTLEERATCPTSCALWRVCYGNQMNWPHRIQADGDLMPLLEAELRKLHARHGRILIRLHVLGDFYSVEYVWFWRHMLDVLPGLHVYGYTARQGCAIADDIEEMNAHPRCWIRFSDGPEGQLRAVTVENADQARDAGAIVCPAQHHAKADDICCASCALCWSTPRTIAFLRH